MKHPEDVPDPVVPAGAHEEETISRATAARWSLYLRCLESRRDEGHINTSSRDLAHVLGVTDSQVRKDLATMGHIGRRGVGYETVGLMSAIRKQLGTDRVWEAVLIGVGNLARALLGYRGFADRGFRIVELFDSDPEKIGEELGGLTIRPVEEIGDRVRESGAELALLTVPAKSAQIVADQLVSAGVRGILNFAPTVLRISPGVRVVAVDFSIHLEQLAFRVRHPERVDGRLSDAYPVV